MYQKEFAKKMKKHNTGFFFAKVEHHTQHNTFHIFAIVVLRTSQKKSTRWTLNIKIILNKPASKKDKIADMWQKYTID